MLIRSQESKMTRLLENNHRLGRVSERHIGDHSYLVLERHNEDGSVTELDHIRQAEAAHLHFTDLEKTPLTEATVLGKKVMVPEGVLGIITFELMLQADTRTRNNTLYSLDEVKREYKAYNKNYVKANKAWGGFKHPNFWTDDYRIEFDNAAVRWFMFNFDETTGIVSGAAYLLDKKEGTDIRAGIRSGGLVGVSSRGWGYGEKFSEYEGLHGTVEDVWVISEWILEGFDIVTDPSAVGAETDQFFTESAKRRGLTENKTPPALPNPKPQPSEENRAMTLEELKEKHPTLYKAVMAEGRRDGRTEAQADFEASAPARREAMVKELTEGENSALVKRVDFDAAKTVAKESQSQITSLTTERDELKAKLDESATERDELKAKVEKAEREAARAEVAAIVEGVLAKHPHKEAIRSKLTESDMSTPEAAKTAIERELNWLHEHFNIPKAPISESQFQRIGKTQNTREDDPEPEAKTPGDTLFEKTMRVATL